MAKCTTCNGTGIITNEFKRKASFKKREIDDLFVALTFYIESVDDEDQAVRGRKLIDKLYKPLKK